MSQVLHVLFVSDLHLNFSTLTRLCTQSKVLIPSIDICLVGGDIANCNHSTRSHNEIEMEHQTEAMLQMLTQTFACRVIMIPGNHDPLKYFEGQSSPNSQNIHGTHIVLADKLTLWGLGGSGPAINQRDEQVWEGYPYKGLEDIKPLAESCLSSIRKDPNSQHIVLAHIGPMASATTISRVDYKNPIRSGSIYFDSFMQESSILCFLHGHTHDGANMDCLNSKPILNPGSLGQGKFMVIKFGHSDRWRVNAVTLHKLE